MTVHIITPRTQLRQLPVTGQHPGVQIMLQQARNASERSTARMIACLAARLEEINVRRNRHA